MSDMDCGPTSTENPHPSSAVGPSPDWMPPRSEQPPNAHPVTPDMDCGPTQTEKCPHCERNAESPISAIGYVCPAACDMDCGPTQTEKCICVRFSDTGGFRIADLTCPVHGVSGTNPGDGMWGNLPDADKSPTQAESPLAQASRLLSEEQDAAADLDCSLGDARTIEPAPMFWREHKFSPTFNDYELGPECPDACPDGWTSHTWQVGIEEHQVTLTTDECNVCSRGIHNGSLDDCLEMAPINVRLAFDSDHGPDGYDLGGWHYDQRCDCNWWWTLTPIEVSP